MNARIRPASPEDAAAIRSIYAPYVEETPICFELEVPTTAEIRERLTTTLERYPWIVCETDEGDVLGYASASALRSMPAYGWTAELSVYVDDSIHRSGIGSALYTSLLATLTEQGFYDAYAAVTIPNPASEGFHERMGFERIGRFPNVAYKSGEWYGVQWWHRQLASRPSEPDEPAPFAEVRGSPDLERALNEGEANLNT
ncbi:N-acetyltransferase family protein [Natrialbaceae archaeon A-gly3]